MNAATRQPQDLIEDFRVNWERVCASPAEVDRLAPFYFIPCTIVAADGTVSHLSDQRDVVTFLQDRLESFLRGGVVSARVWGVEVLALAEYAALVTVNWELRRNDNSVERAYRICYNLVRVADDWKILLSTYQDGS